MVRRISPARALICSLALAPLIIQAYKEGAPPGNAGVPGEGSPCVRSGCHQGTVAPNTGQVEISIQGGNSYTPGAAKHIVVTIHEPARSHGFEAALRLAEDPRVQRGSITPGPGCQIVRDGSFEYVTHADRTRNTFPFDWTPPQSGGDVRLYVAGVAADGKKDTRVYTADVLLTSARRPTVAPADGVVSGASFQPGVCPASWVTIYGQNLAPVTRMWAEADFPDPWHLPLELDGVKVQINGKPAAIYYISPGQLNVLAPDDDAAGPVEVIVETPDGRSDPVVANLQPLQPALFAFSQQGYRYAAAVHHPDGDLVGPPGLIPGANVRPVKPGDVIYLYGTGFGPTEPRVPAGMVVNSPKPLTRPVRVTVGGVEAAQLWWAGLVSPGLYQFNITVPEVADGDQPVEIEFEGLRTQQGLYLPVQR